MTVARVVEEAVAAKAGKRDIKKAVKAGLKDGKKSAKKLEKKSGSARKQQ
jgi:hypothetical protein